MPSSVLALIELSENVQAADAAAEPAAWRTPSSVAPVMTLRAAVPCLLSDAPTTPSSSRRPLAVTPGIELSLTADAPAAPVPTAGWVYVIATPS